LRSVGKVELTAGKVEFKGNSTTVHEISGEGLELKGDAELKLATAMLVKGATFRSSGDMQLGGITDEIGTSRRRSQTAEDNAVHGILVIDGDSVLISNGSLAVATNASILFNTTGFSVISGAGLENHGHVNVAAGDVTVSEGGVHSDGMFEIGSLGSLNLDSPADESVFGGTGVVIMPGGYLTIMSGMVSFLAEVVGCSRIIGSISTQLDFSASSGCTACPDGVAGNCDFAPTSDADIAAVCSFNDMIARLLGAASLSTGFCGESCGRPPIMRPMCVDFIQEHGQNGFDVANECASGPTCDLKALADAISMNETELVMDLVVPCQEVHSMLSCQSP